MPHFSKKKPQGLSTIGQILRLSYNLEMYARAFLWAQLYLLSIQCIARPIYLCIFIQCCRNGCSWACSRL